MTKWTLGVNAYLHDSAVALLRDDELVFAVAEERLSRLKKDSGFPARSIAAALEHGGIGFDDLDIVAFGWNKPGRTPISRGLASVRQSEGRPAGPCRRGPAPGIAE